MSRGCAAGVYEAWDFEQPGASCADCIGMETPKVLPDTEWPDIGDYDVNRLYYGDNLEILRRYVKDESVDLVYLDPPFQSGRDHNVLFEQYDTTKSSAQIRAFEDTWRWSLEAEESYRGVVEAGGQLSRAMQSFRTLLGESDMMAYLCMMAPRLGKLHDALKPTGSLFLHCDPTASHYLKLLLDSVFSPQNFRGEVIWKRTSSHNSARRFGPVHDVILHFSKGAAPKWNSVRGDYDDEYLARFKKVDPNTGERFDDKDLTGPGTRNGPSGKAWRGFNPTAKGRHWQPASYVYEQYRLFTGEDLAQYDFLQRLDKMDEAGLIFWPKKKGGWPRYKQFAKTAPGMTLQDVWTDIDPVNSQAAERLGYPTQKPVALLERIILSATSEGDLVLDPFCGCGTAAHAAQKLNREWIGIDITHLATNLIKHRITTAFDNNATFEVVGEPTDISGARQLAEDDRFQFQCWALGLVGARATDSNKKGPDRGIDGRLYFHEGQRNGSTKQVVFSVKSGHVSVRDVRDLRGVVEREKAAIGCLVTLEEPTRPMQREALGAGFYHSPWGEHPKIQILTIQQLLGNDRLDFPVPRFSNRTLRKAVREYRPVGEQVRRLT